MSETQGLGHGGTLAQAAGRGKREAYAVIPRRPQKIVVVNVVVAVAG
jgi:hypothetical protein